MTVESVAEDAILIRLGSRIDPALTPRIALLDQRIRDALADLVLDLVPSYTTLLCRYDADRIDFRRMEAILRRLLAELSEESANLGHSPAEHDIPVYYHPEVGPDLEALARHAGLAVETLVSRHTAVTYQVFAIGFNPGFGFLGEVDASIAAPRHATPRTRVPAGSVGIAERQTAIYPLESPGGWQLIGRSPVTLFDPEHLSRLQVGDQVRFRSISRREYLDLGGRL